MSKSLCFFSNTGGDCSHEEKYECLYDLRYDEIDKRCFPGSKSVIEILLLRADLFYQPKMNLRQIFICNGHKQQLLEEFWSSERRKCNVCMTCFGKSSANSATRNINTSQAITIYEHFKLKHSYGTLICNRCRSDLGPFINNEKQELHEARFKWILDIKISDDESDNESSDAGSNFIPSQSSIGSDQSDIKKQQCMALNKFLELCNIRKQVRVTKSYTNLTEQSKRNFLSTTRIMIKSIVGFVALNDTNIVINELFNIDDNKSNIILDDKFLSVMAGIAETYNNATEWSIRRQILSIVASKISYKLIQGFIPGLTLYRFTAARLHAAQFGTGAVVERTSTTIQKFEPEQINHFVDFIISPHICSDMPFGERILKLPNGSELYVPETIRNVIPTRIIQQYYQYCDEMFSGFKTLNSSSLYKILSICKASTRKSFQGLNYFAADGSEPFDCLIEIIQDIYIDRDKKKHLIDNLKRGKQYIKSDFKVHVAKLSTIADHCTTAQTTN
ncbi:unnamed protein product [Didymodactylos carnosus]|uniref:Uncharacterized protein n=1 Tax=Didymodactylos carnosus TaxID=1234261 RepID=A0A8S2L5H5_9BILA|nr:unnamed protein product [Didymodactylos carnosus]CAF3881386.1 unnamed protein product [Didymodactylos carnosus]